MWHHLVIYLFIFHNVDFAESAYSPVGDEVQAGSVLLPASRRGRYLANIARRQAVDGTGIKFNKEADRINAEAKKKVDVLSEELLPYIIAEQERRTTLYKRVMTAIQNGEKGITIAEIRNKPPAIIRKGLMYRCPNNSAPREPDGSGSIICEYNLKPTPIIFESCLSAEDKELYVADNKYFFCNRHKVEGPDLPRNGTMVVACAPCERTPLNYTTQKCALEDTDDVVVHYRYYPDRTYKFVSELDPMHEVCDHWNPCQIGYIFSLPGPDQATPATELWQDSMFETVPVANVGQNFTMSMTRTTRPEGYNFVSFGYRYNTSTNWRRIVPPKENIPENMSFDYKELKKYVKVMVKFHPLRDSDYGSYYVYCQHPTTKHRNLQYYFIERGMTKLTPTVLDAMPGQQLNLTSVVYVPSDQCALEGIVLRATDGSFRNLELNKYHQRNTSEQKVIDFKFGKIRTSDFGDYFVVIQYTNGTEERIKAITIQVIFLKAIRTAATVRKPVDMETTYKCVDSCVLLDVLCNGKSVLASGGVEHIATSKQISLNFASFKDENACVYLAKFKIGDNLYRKNLAIVEKVKLEPLHVEPPEDFAPFERIINYTCSRPECSLKNIIVNGSPLENKKERSSNGSFAYYLLETGSVTIIVTEYSSMYEGVYQGVFTVGADLVTKNLLEIGPHGLRRNMQDSGREHENQTNVPVTESLAQAPTEGDGGGGASARPEKNNTQL